MDRKTLELMAKAMKAESTLIDPIGYFENQGLDYETVRSVVHRYQAGTDGSRFSSFVTGLGMGIEIGKLLSDPISQMDDTDWRTEPVPDSEGRLMDDIGPSHLFRCPVDACEFRSTVDEYRGNKIVCPTHFNPVVPGQEGWR